MEDRRKELMQRIATTDRQIAALQRARKQLDTQVKQLDTPEYVSKCLGAPCPSMNEALRKMKRVLMYHQEVGVLSCDCRCIEYKVRFEIDAGASSDDDDAVRTSETDRRDEKKQPTYFIFVWRNRLCGYSSECRFYKNGVEVEGDEDEYDSAVFVSKDMWHDYVYAYAYDDMLCSDDTEEGDAAYDAAKAKAEEKGERMSRYLADAYDSEELYLQAMRDGAKPELVLLLKVIETLCGEDFDPTGRR
jgi:hypothetical protein